jgi:hypothetical protein
MARRSATAPAIPIGPVFCLLTGLILLAVGVSRSGVGAAVCVSYGLGFVNVAALDRFLAFRGAPLLSIRSLASARRNLRDLRIAVTRSVRSCFPSRFDLVWLAAATGLAACLRAYSLRQPVWYDEAFTFLYFVRRGFPALLNYPLPNNHILHTILVYCSTLLFGTDPVCMRLPAFLAGVAAVPLTFCLSRRISGDRSGYLAVIGVSVTAMYWVFYSVMARGYTMVGLFALVLAFVGLDVIKRPTLSACGALAALGALGMLTIPTMLFALGAVYCWLAALLAIERRSLRPAIRDFLVPSAIMTLLLTAVLYTPSILVSGGVESIVANSFVQSLSWNSFIGGLPQHLRDIRTLLLWDVPGWVVMAYVLLVPFGVIRAALERNWPATLFVPAIVAGSAAVFVLKQSIPFPRTWTYVIPFAAIAADTGITYLIRPLPRLAPRLLALLLFAWGVYGAAGAMSEDIIARGADFPDGSPLARDLRSVMNVGDIVHAKIPTDVPLYFYMWYYDVPDQTRIDARHRNEFFVVEKRTHSIADLTDAPVTVIAEYPGATLYRLRDAPSVSPGSDAMADADWVRATGGGTRFRPARGR